ncbi:MAG TPA: class I SAM-dependent methyltransferase [Chryseolinea sp.]|nr:class I SAM-dependent methyltransferase [Chryseolinea sp.]
MNKFFFRQSFHPGLPGLFLNPFYFIRKQLYDNIRNEAPSLSGRLLDFGCGSKPYEDLFKVDEYIGIDMENTGHGHANSKIDVFYDGKTIPFPDNSFDCVFCSEVFEHIFNLEEVLVEIRRVMKPGAQILITVPFCWNEHEVPYDFGRYTSFGIKHLMEKQGFRVIRQNKSGNFARVNFQLLALYFYSLVNTKNKIVDYLLRMALIAPVNIIGSILLVIMPKNDSMYFNNIVLAKKSD